MDVGHVEDKVLNDANVVRLAARPDHVVHRHAVRGEVCGAERGARYLRVVAPDVAAMTPEHAELVPDRAGATNANRLQASAYLATSRSVFFSPMPPIMIGGCGGLKTCGLFSVSARR